MRLSAGSGLMLLITAAAPVAAQTPWCFTGLQPGHVAGTVFFPRGELFCPLAADPKQEHSFISFLSAHAPALQEGVEPRANAPIGSIGLADGLALLRYASGEPETAIQLGLSGGVFAQFELDRPLFDLINADYLVALPLTLRVDDFSLRLRVYHQSSHLGDEFLIRTNPAWEHLSYEAIELLFAQELGPIRTYGGGEYLFRREPDALGRTVAHGGVELRVGESRGLRFMGALDARASEQQDWEPGWNIRAGIEVAHGSGTAHPPLLVSILVEYYHGFLPYGQFFLERARWWGLGLHMGI